MTARPVPRMNGICPMPLPPRIYWSVTEVAAKCECTPAHVLQLSSAGHFPIMAALPRLLTEAGLRISGLCRVPAGDLLCLGRFGPGAPGECHVHRVIPQGAEDPDFIAAPEAGVRLTLDDLVVPSDALDAFMAANGINGSRYVTPPSSNPRYDWDGMTAALVRRIHNEGVPPSQAKLVEEMLDWFMARSETGDAPDARSIRRRISPIWNALQEAQEEA